MPIELSAPASKNQKKFAAGFKVSIFLFVSMLVGGYFMPQVDSRFAGKSGWIEIKCPNEGQWTGWSETDKFLWRQEQEHNYLRPFGPDGCYRRN